MERLSRLFSLRSSRQNEMKNKDWSKKLTELKKIQTLRMNMEPRAGTTKNKDLSKKKEEERKRKAAAAEKADAILRSLSSACKEPTPPHAGEISAIRSAAISLPAAALQKTPRKSAKDPKSIDAKIEETRKKNAIEKADSIVSELILNSSMIEKPTVVKHTEYADAVSQGNEALASEKMDEGAKQAEEETLNVEDDLLTELLTKWNKDYAVQHRESSYHVNQTLSLEEAEYQERKEIKLDDDLQLHLDTAAASRRIRFPVTSHVLGSESSYLGSGTLYQDWYSRVESNKLKPGDCFAKLLRK